MCIMTKRLRLDLRGFPYKVRNTKPKLPAHSLTTKSKKILSNFEHNFLLA